MLDSREFLRPDRPEHIGNRGYQGPYAFLLVREFAVQKHGGKVEVLAAKPSLPAVQPNARIVEQGHAVIEKAVEVEAYALHEALGHCHNYETQVLGIRIHIRHPDDVSGHIQDKRAGTYLE